MLTPLCPTIDLSLLANLLGTADKRGNSPAIDYLLDTLAGMSDNDRLADVLLCYARDASARLPWKQITAHRCPKCGENDFEKTTMSPIGELDTNRSTCQRCPWRGQSWETEVQPYMLLANRFPESVLCRYLDASGQPDRATAVAMAFMKWNTEQGRWLAEDGKLTLADPKNAARSRKRAVLACFPDVARVETFTGRHLVHTPAQAGHPRDTYSLDGRELSDITAGELEAKPIDGGWEVVRTIKPLDLLPDDIATTPPI